MIRSLTALFLLALWPVLALAGVQDEVGPKRYVQVTVDRVTARNISDPRGLSVGAFQRGTPLAVYREQADFLAVEAPGGFKAWVLGRFLRTTKEPGVREVTGNGVNIRPGPKNDVTNFPLGTALFAGDRVRVLKKSDEQLSDAEAWFQILTPPGVTAWVERTAVGPFAPGVDVKDAWQSAVALAAPVMRRKPATPAEIAPESKETPRDVLASARAKVAVEREKNMPDFASARAELQRAKTLAGTGAVAVEAQAELERVDALENAAALRDELQNERQRVVSDAAEVQAEAWSRARQKDPLGALFRARGVLERRLELDGTPRYVLVAGGSETHELISKGRYNLDLFLGCQVGVRGSERAVLGSPVLTVDALEVVRAR